MRTPITPMMNSAAVSASDSASTGCPPSRQHDRAGDRHQQQHARELECEQVIPEERLGDHSNRIQLLELLLVEVSRHYQLLREFGPSNDHDLTEQSKTDQSSGELPPFSSGVHHLGRMAEVEQHDNEEENNHDRARVDQHLHDADELRIEHHEQ